MFRLRILITLFLFHFFFTAPVVLQAQTTPPVTPTPQVTDFGETTVSKWKDGKTAAFTMFFDDSMESQADNAIPPMLGRNLVGTWLINPGTERYKNRASVWESLPPKGHELANHTMNHIGATDLAMAEYEIGETANIIWSLNPLGSSKLLTFQQGGGTSWNISSSDWNYLNQKYNLVYRSGSISMHGVSADTLISPAKRALQNGSWEKIHFHGVGGEWYPTDTLEFIKLLDYLVSVRENLWIATHLEVYKYIKERDTAKIEIVEKTPAKLRLDLTSNMNSSLYDQPLTLVTLVPDSWKTCSALQDTHSLDCNVIGGKAFYQVVPGKGIVTLSVLPTPTPAAKPGDANGDGKVTGTDYIIWIDKYGLSTTKGYADADFNLDGRVTGQDFVLWIDNYSS